MADFSKSSAKKPNAKPGAAKRSQEADGPKQPPEWDEEAKKLAENADEKKGDRSLARDRQLPARKDAKPKDVESRDAGKNRRNRTNKPRKEK